MFLWKKQFGGYTAYIMRNCVIYAGHISVLLLGNPNTESYVGLRFEFAVAYKIHISSGETSWKATTSNGEEVGHETIIFKIKFLVLLLYGRYKSVWILASSTVLHQGLWRLSCGKMVLVLGW
jgi:hypothetical protein